MPRTRTRFLLATFLTVFAAVPTVAHAAPALNLDSTDVTGPALDDGILGPGDTVDVRPFLTVGDQDFSGGNGTISAPDGSGVSTPSYLRSIPAASRHTATYPASPFVMKLENDYVCGRKVPLTLAVNGPGVAETFPLDIKTGAAGPLKRYTSTDIGDTVLDAETVESDVAVTEDGRVKSVRVHLDSITHKYSLRWYELTLVSPAGTRVKLYDRFGENDQKTFENVTFSDRADLEITDPSITQFHDVDVRPVESLAKFDGEPAAGNWRVEFRDVHDNVSSRSARGAGRAGDGEVVGTIDGWSLDVAGATCSRLPQPWFSPEPLILSPGGGTVLDASASVDPGNKNGSSTQPGAIVSYAWDLDGVAGFESTGASPTITSPVIAKGKRNVTLRVTDNDGQTADKTIEALITEIPTVSAVTVTPAAPEAGQLVTLAATASDPDGSIAKYEWDFNGDGVFEVAGTAATTTHTWATSGPQVVRVRVTDDTGATKVKAIIVSIANKPPVARLKVSASPVIIGNVVTLDASDSSDPDGEIVAYDWDLDGMAGFEVTTKGVPTLPYTFNETGLHQITVRVTDNSGQSDLEQLTVLVTAAPNAVISASTTTPAPAQTVTFDGTASADPDPAGSIVKYEWDLDGNNSYETTGNAVVAKAYPNVSNVQVKLRVTNNNGAKGETYLAVSVKNPAAGGGGPVPVPTPVATPKPGGGNGGGSLPTPGPGVVADVPGLTPAPVTPELIVGDTGKAFAVTQAPVAEGVLDSGFQAKLSVASKQKAKKALKGGIIVKVTANAPGTIVVKGMVAAKLAKTMGLKPKKNAPLAVASGKLVIKKAGTFKFVVKVPKKYQRAVKKSKKTAITLRAAVTEKETGDILAIGKTVTVVK